jgi:ankyrin repeat protein
VVRLLLEHKADIDGGGVDGLTALRVATRNEYKTVALLLEPSRTMPPVISQGPIGSARVFDE